MARTQAPEYEERREKIVEKAADLIAELGFRGTTLGELAIACEYSKSLIYYYFSSKEEILYAVMASHVDVLVEDVSNVTALHRPPREALGMLIRTFMQHYVGAASRQKVLLNELNSLPEDKRAIVVAKQRRVIDAVQSLLVEIEPSLRGDEARARVKTMLLLGMINWTHTWFDHGGPVSSEDVADMVCELIGIGRPISPQPAD